MFIQIWQNSQYVYTVTYDKNPRDGGKIVSVKHECAYCGGSGVVEIERAEGLFNCPVCHPDKP